MTIKTENKDFNKDELQHFMDEVATIKFDGKEVANELFNTNPLVKLLLSIEQVGFFNNSAMLFQLVSPDKGHGMIFINKNEKEGYDLRLFKLSGEPSKKFDGRINVETLRFESMKNCTYENVKLSDLFDTLENVTGLRKVC